MNELIAMWEARANSENNSDVALAIMQCVGELQSTQEYAEYKEVEYQIKMETELAKGAYRTLGSNL